MNWRAYLFLALLGGCVLLGLAAFQPVPGYMDAEYYFGGGLRLYQGFGFSEQILWNYLDDPQGLPHPSHTYWMPLASILAFAGMKALGSSAFWAGRLGFILAAIGVPPLTASLAYRFSRQRDSAFFAGMLAVFSAFYLPYLPTTDTFAIYMLLGTMWLWLGDGYSLRIDRREVAGWAHPFLFSFLLGLISGGMHLTRADGLLWAVFAVGLVLFSSPWDAPNLKPKLMSLGVCLAGYFLVMAPWMLRNQNVFGSPLSPGGLKTLWLTDYDDLYLYPASQLTFERWWGSGLAEIIKSRLWASGINLQSVLAVQMEIFLAPLVLWGWWRLRHERLMRLGALIWGVTMGAMTLIFPFAGARGGFFHSGAAFQPLFWATVPVGLEGFIAWGNRLRGWRASQARWFFQSGLLLLAGVLSVIIVTNRVLRTNGRNPGDSQRWSESMARYVHLEQALQALAPAEGAVILVNNPPGFYLASGRSSIAIPDGDIASLLAVARRFGGRYLLLEPSHPRGLEELYQNPGDRPGLRYLTSLDGVHIFEFYDR